MKFNYEAAMKALTESTVNADSAKEAHLERKIAQTKNKTELTQWMWEGLDKNDLPEIKAAIAAGALITSRREGKPLLWVALSRGHMEIAAYALEQGADINANTIQRETVWHAIIPLDNVDSAEQVVKWGGDLSELPFADLITAPNLASWIIQKASKSHSIFTHNKKKFSTIISENNPTQWFMSALSHPTLGDQLNKIFGIDASDVGALEKKQIGRDSFVEILWAQIAKKDHVATAQKAISLGWGMPNPQNPRSSHWFHPGWGLARGKAWNLVEWYRSVPELCHDMDEQARQCPEKTWWPVMDTATDLERLRNLDVDFSLANTEGYNALTYFMRSNWKISKSLVDNLIKYQVDLFTSPDPNGQIPMNFIKDAKLKAYAEKKIMKASTTPAPIKQSPARPRL